VQDKDNDNPIKRTAQFEHVVETIPVLDRIRRIRSGLLRSSRRANPREPAARVIIGEHYDTSPAAYNQEDRKRAPEVEGGLGAI